MSAIRWQGKAACVRRHRRLICRLLTAHFDLALPLKWLFGFLLVPTPSSEPDQGLLISIPHQSIVALAPTPRPQSDLLPRLISRPSSPPSPATRLASTSTTPLALLRSDDHMFFDDHMFSRSTCYFRLLCAYRSIQNLRWPARAAVLTRWLACPLQYNA